jgi:hypothetical protein
VTVRNWLREERQRAGQLLDRAEVQLQGIAPRRGAKLLLRFARSMRKFTR